MLRRVDALLIPFSILWGGFVIFWEVGVLTMPSSGFFGLFGVPFILAGVYFMIGRFFHDAWRRRGVLYGLTTERVLIISRSDLKSINLASCGELRLARHRDGRGTISIGPELSLFASNGMGIWTGAPGVPTLEAIVDAELIFAEVRRLQKAARTPYRVSAA